MRKTARIGAEGRQQQVVAPQQKGAAAFARQPHHRMEMPRDIRALPRLVPQGDADASALLAWAKEHLASYKLPRQVVFVAQLPHTRSGKLLRRDLPRRLADIPGGSADPGSAAKGEKRE